MQLSLSSQMSNQEIGKIFSFIAEVLAAQPGNQYRVRAYEDAGVFIEQQNHSLAEDYAQLRQKEPEKAREIFREKLLAMPAIGESIADKLLELFETGNISSFQKYLKNVPAGVYPLVQLSGIGYKKASKLAEAFKLDSANMALEKVLEAAQAGEVRDLEGFGEKSELALIDLLQAQYQKTRIPYAQAKKEADELVQAVSKIPALSQVTVLGSLRRQAATVGDIDLGACAEDEAALRAALTQIPLIKKVLVAGDNMIRIYTTHDRQVDLKLSKSAEWGSFLQHFTGSKEHNIRLREIALKKGFSLSEHGIKIKATGELKKFANEADFYQFLGFALIPPAQRIGGTEFSRYQLK
jgi:DNA polymerase (family 10)